MRGEILNQRLSLVQLFGIGLCIGKPPEGKAIVGIDIGVNALIHLADDVVGVDLLSHGGVNGQNALELVLCILGQRVKLVSGQIACRYRIEHICRILLVGRVVAAYCFGNPPFGLRRSG